MPAPSNEQSLLQDRAEHLLAAGGVSTAACDWRGSRTLLVHVDPNEWAAAGRSMPDVESAAADRGFKVLLLAPAGLAPAGLASVDQAPVRQDGAPAANEAHDGRTDREDPR